MNNAGLKPKRSSMLELILSASPTTPGSWNTALPLCTWVSTFFRPNSASISRNSDMGRRFAPDTFTPRNNSILISATSAPAPPGRTGSQPAAEHPRRSYVRMPQPQKQFQHETAPTCAKLRIGRAEKIFGEEFSALSCIGLATTIMAQVGIQHVIAPSAVDLQIALRHALIFEATFFQHPARCGVFRQAGRFDP